MSGGWSTEHRGRRTDLEYEDLRVKVIETGKAMIDRGLTIGTGGNVSTRCPDGESFLITLSGIPYHELVTADIVKVDLQTGSVFGERRPSIEIHLHWNAFLKRPDVGAVVHVHSPIASALAAARKPLPVILDVCALSLRGQVEVAEYGMSGSKELADNTISALGQNNAVLMANHGSLCVGKDLATALDRCELLERVCLTYIYSTVLGGAVPLPAETIVSLQASVGKNYGQKR